MEPQTPGNPPTPTSTPQAPAPQPSVLAPAEQTQPAVSAVPSPAVTPVSMPDPIDVAPTVTPAPVEPNKPAATPTPVGTPTDNGNYKVFQAVKDVFTSIKRAPVTTLVPLVLGYSASILFTFLTLFLLGIILAVAMPNAGFEALVFLIPVIILSTIVGSLVQLAFTSASILAIKESFEGTRGSLSVYLKQSFHLFGKVLLASLWFIVRVCWPILVANILFFVGLFMGPLGPIINILGFLVSAGTVVWALIFAIRYNLFWQVAVFEPTTSAKQSLSRSRELIKGRGEWFIVRTALLLGVFLAVINVISGGNINGSESTQSNWLFFVLFVFITPFAFGIPTMLYLHLSGNKKQPEPASPPQPQPLAPPSAPSQPL